MARKPSAKNFPSIASITPDTVHSAARGLYWYCAANHSGQGSSAYRIMSELTYRPGCLERGPDDESQPYYMALKHGFIAAQDALDAIVTAESPAPYYTVIIPPVPVAYATEWHAPDMTLSRGYFKTESEAIDWAAKRLLGAPYSIRLIDGK